MQADLLVSLYNSRNSALKERLVLGGDDAAICQVCISLGSCARGKPDCVVRPRFGRLVCFGLASQWTSEHT